MSATKWLRKHLPELTDGEIADFVNRLQAQLGTERNMMIRSSLLQQKKDAEYELTRRAAAARLLTSDYQPNS